MMRLREKIAVAATAFGIVGLSTVVPAMAAGDAFTTTGDVNIEVDQNGQYFAAGTPFVTVSAQLTPGTAGFLASWDKLGGTWSTPQEATGFLTGGEYAVWEECRVRNLAGFLDAQDDVWNYKTFLQRFGTGVMVTPTPTPTPTPTSTDGSEGSSDSGQTDSQTAPEPYEQWALTPEQWKVIEQPCGTRLWDQSQSRQEYNASTGVVTARIPTSVLPIGKHDLFIVPITFSANDASGEPLKTCVAEDWWDGKVVVDTCRVQSTGTPLTTAITVVDPNAPKPEATATTSTSSDAAADGGGLNWTVVAVVVSILVVVGAAAVIGALLYLRRNDHTGSGPRPGDPVSGPAPDRDGGDEPDDDDQSTLTGLFRMPPTDAVSLREPRPRAGRVFKRPAPPVAEVAPRADTGADAAVGMGADTAVGMGAAALAGLAAARAAAAAPGSAAASDPPLTHPDAAEFPAWWGVTDAHPAPDDPAYQRPEVVAAAAPVRPVDAIDAADGDEADEATAPPNTVAAAAPAAPAVAILADALDGDTVAVETLPAVAVETMPATADDAPPAGPVVDPLGVETVAIETRTGFEDVAAAPVAVDVPPPATRPAKTTAHPGVALTLPVLAPTADAPPSAGDVGAAPAAGPDEDPETVLISTPTTPDRAPAQPPGDAPGAAPARPPADAEPDADADADTDADTVLIGVTRVDDAPPPDSTPATAAPVAAAGADGAVAADATEDAAEPADDTAEHPRVIGENAPPAAPTAGAGSVAIATPDPASTADGAVAAAGAPVADAAAATEADAADEAPAESPAEEVADDDADPDPWTFEDLLAGTHHSQRHEQDDPAADVPTDTAPVLPPPTPEHPAPDGER